MLHIIIKNESGKNKMKNYIRKTISSTLNLVKAKTQKTIAVILVFSMLFNLSVDSFGQMLNTDLFNREIQETKEKLRNGSYPVAIADATLINSGVIEIQKKIEVMENFYKNNPDIKKAQDLVSRIEWNFYELIEGKGEKGSKEHEEKDITLEEYTRISEEQISDSVKEYLLQFAADKKKALEGIENTVSAIRQASLESMQKDYAEGLDFLKEWEKNDPEVRRGISASRAEAIGVLNEEREAYLLEASGEKTSLAKIDKWYEESLGLIERRTKDILEVEKEKAFEELGKKKREYISLFNSSEWETNKAKELSDEIEAKYKEGLAKIRMEEKKLKQKIPGEYQKYISKTAEEKYDEFVKKYKGYAEELEVLYSKDEKTGIFLLAAAPMLFMISEDIFSDGGKEFLVEVSRSVLENDKECKKEGNCKDQINALTTLGILGGMDYFKEKERREEGRRIRDFVEKYLDSIYINKIILTGISALLEMKDYRAIESILHKAQEKEWDISSLEMSADMITLSTYVEMGSTVKGQYYGKISQKTDYEIEGIVGNAFSDIAIMLGADGSPEARALLNTYGINKCEILYALHIDGKEYPDIYCRGIIPFIAGALMTKKTHFGNIKKALGKVPQLNPEGQLEVKEIYDIQPGYYPKDASSYIAPVQKLVSEKQSGQLEPSISEHNKNLRLNVLELMQEKGFDRGEEVMAMLIVNRGMGDMSAVAEKQLDSDLLETYPNIEEHLKDLAVVDESRFEAKKKRQERKKNFMIGANIVDLALIFLMGAGIVKSLLKGLISIGKVSARLGPRIWSGIKFAAKGTRADRVNVFKKALKGTGEGIKNFTGKAGSSIGEIVKNQRAMYTSSLTPKNYRLPDGVEVVLQNTVWNAEKNAFVTSNLKEALKGLGKSGRREAKAAQASLDAAVRQTNKVFGKKRFFGESYEKVLKKNIGRAFDRNPYLNNGQKLTGNLFGKNLEGISKPHYPDANRSGVFNETDVTTKTVEKTVTVTKSVEGKLLFNRNNSKFWIDSRKQGEVIIEEGRSWNNSPIGGGKVSGKVAKFKGKVPENLLTNERLYVRKVRVNPEKMGEQVGVIDNAKYDVIVKEVGLISENGVFSRIGYLNDFSIANKLSPKKVKVPEFPSTPLKIEPPVVSHGKTGKSTFFSRWLEVKLTDSKPVAFLKRTIKNTGVGISMTIATLQPVAAQTGTIANTLGQTHNATMVASINPFSQAFRTVETLTYTQPSSSSVIKISKVFEGKGTSNIITKMKGSSFSNNFPPAAAIIYGNPLDNHKNNLAKLLGRMNIQPMFNPRWLQGKSTIIMPELVILPVVETIVGSSVNLLASLKLPAKAVKPDTQEVYVLKNGDKQESWDLSPLYAAWGNVRTHKGIRRILNSYFSSGVLSLNGLGGWVERINNSHTLKVWQAEIGEAFKKALDNTDGLYNKEYSTSVADRNTPEYVALLGQSLKNALAETKIPEVLHQKIVDLLQSDAIRTAKPITPGRGFFGSETIIPESDKIKSVKAYYVGENGQEIELPLVINIDKGIKIKDAQRIVFNAEYRLEIRNGAKKPQKVEHLYMTLNDEPASRIEFLEALSKAKLPGLFKIKIQTVGKRPRQLKDISIKTEDLQTILPVEAQIDKSLLKNDETVIMTKDGDIALIDESGEKTILKNVTFRIPKNEIGNLIKVIKDAEKAFVMNVLPTENKVPSFFFNFLAAISIMAIAPVFDGIFKLGDFWTSLIMGIVSFGPAILTPFMGYFFSKYGTLRTMKASSILACGGIILAIISGFHGYSSAPHSPWAVGAAITGLTMLSLSNEIKFSAMSPLINSNFETKKALSVTTQSLMARSLGTILFLEITPLFNLIAAQAGLAKLPEVDSTLAFALLSLFAGIGLMKLLRSRLRDVPSSIESANISLKTNLKTLLKIFLKNRDIRNGALAFTLFESFEATLSLILFKLAKDYYADGSNIPDLLGGFAIYASMVVGRYIISKLQAAGILNAEKTYLYSALMSFAGSVLFAAGGVSFLGFLGAALAFIGTSNFLPPLYNVTSKRNPGNSNEISLLFFTMSTLALLSTMILGAVIDIFGIKSAFIVPIVSLLTGLYLSKHVFDLSSIQNMKLPKKRNKTNIDINNPQTN